MLKIQIENRKRVVMEEDACMGIVTDGDNTHHMPFKLKSLSESGQ